ncbi:MAG: ABC transporter permease [Clostridia bacterium]|nr:ABC transporter permease [Clostridia bacterium]
MTRSISRILKSYFMRTFIAVLLGFVVASAILFITGYNPSQCMAVMFNAVFSRPKFIVNVILKSTPIILTGLSVAFAFKMGLFNIGAEGQYIVSTIAAAIAGLVFNFHPIIQVPLVIMSGVFAGAIFGGIIGFLKSKFGIHEVITSIMLNWIALYLCNYISNLACFHKPESDGTYPINESGLTLFMYKWKFSEEGRSFLKNNPVLNDIILKTDFNFNFILAVIIAIVVWVVIYKTRKGYEFRACGLNPDAAQNAGIDVNKNIIYTMLISGALSGLAGALALTGSSNPVIHVLPVFENYGFNGLSVALIAGSSPIGCIFAGVMFSALIYAGQSLQFKLGAPSEIVNIMIGTIVFFVALSVIIPMIVDKIVEKEERKSA